MKLAMAAINGDAKSRKTGQWGLSRFAFNDDKSSGNGPQCLIPRADVCRQEQPVPEGST